MRQSHIDNLLPCEDETKCEVDLTQDQNIDCAGDEATKVQTVFYTCSNATKAGILRNYVLIEFALTLTLY